MFLLKNKDKQYFYGYSTLTEGVIVKPLKLPEMEPQFFRCATPQSSQCTGYETRCGYKCLVYWMPKTYSCNDVCCKNSHVVTITISSASSNFTMLACPKFVYSVFIKNTVC